MATQIIAPGNTTFVANELNTEYLLAAGTSLDVTGDDPAILIEDSADLSTFTIEGTLSSEATGLDYERPSDLQSLDVVVAASGSVLVNSGAAALTIRAEETVFENHGIVEAPYSFEAVEIASGSYSNGASSTIVNTGTISANGGAMSVMADLVTFENSGSISADYLTVWIYADNAVINNSGTIEVNYALASYEAAIEVTGTVFLENTGRVISDAIAITCATSRGSTSDFATIVNSGTIEGAVNLGAGADSFTATNGGITTGWVDAGKGKDHLKGSYEADAFSGGGDDDKLKGNAGDDTLYGDNGNDTILGGQNSDLLDGGNGDDRLNGGKRADTVLGGAGDDTLFGENGDDILIGGAGHDIMEGGAGSDTFVFEALSDSVRNARRDLIKDFESGTDLIDLSALPESSFIGTEDFSATAPVNCA